MLYFTKYSRSENDKDNILYVYPQMVFYCVTFQKLVANFQRFAIINTWQHFGDIFALFKEYARTMSQANMLAYLFGECRDNEVVLRKRLIFLRRDNAIFFPHNSSQEMRASCSIARSKHLTILWRKDNASKSCHH